MLFGRSKQAYYKHGGRSELRRRAMEEFIVRFVKSVRSKDPGIGGVKLWHMYRREFPADVRVGRDRFMSALYVNGLMLRTKPRRPRTTDSSHGLPVYPNLAADFVPSSPDSLWVSDITYIPYLGGGHDRSFCYLSMILDAYTEEIVGWSVGPTLDTRYPLEALRMALRRISGRRVELIHHSDRGCQYASREYTGLLSDRGIRISMTGSGDPKENAQAERVNGTVKNELLRGMRFRCVEDVRKALCQAVSFYNLERPHMSIDMMTPAQAAACRGELRKRWRSFRLEALKRRQDTLPVPENSLPLQGCEKARFGIMSDGNHKQVLGNPFQE